MMNDSQELFLFWSDPGLDASPILLPTVADSQLQSAPSKTRPNLAAVHAPELAHIGSLNAKKCFEPQLS